MTDHKNIAEMTKSQAEVAEELAKTEKEREEIRMNRMANEAATKAAKAVHQNDTIFSK